MYFRLPNKYFYNFQLVSRAQVSCLVPTREHNAHYSNLICQFSLYISVRFVTRVSHYSICVDNFRWFVWIGPMNFAVNIFLFAFIQINLNRIISPLPFSAEGTIAFICIRQPVCQSFFLSVCLFVQFSTLFYAFEESYETY